jgi:hypothetical protein
MNSQLNTIHNELCHHIDDVTHMLCINLNTVNHALCHHTDGVTHMLGFNLNTIVNPKSSFRKSENILFEKEYRAA